MTAEPGPVAAVVHAALDRLAGDFPGLGIALSGGGDSTALMHLAHDWARRSGLTLKAVTVDHGLRPDSADEARQAGMAAAALGISHDTLVWSREGGGNLMAAAREARLRLISDWARRHGLDAVLLGHTLDDQAETLLMRLGRGAGIDGLSGMVPLRRSHGLCWLRPMLAVSRADLRDWLRARGVTWVEDPSNQNRDFDRIRTRKALAALDLPARQLAQSAENLAMARDALQHFAAQAAQGARVRAGALDLPWDAFRDAPAEIRRRLLVAGLRFVTGADYPARREQVLHALDALPGGARLTLDGVIAETGGGFLRMIREPAAAARSPEARPDAAGNAVWDRRWRLRGLRPGWVVRALGYDLLPGLGWRGAGLGRDELAAGPGIWAGTELVAAPLIPAGDGPCAQPLRGLCDFRAMLYTH
ncbi:tRNA(Ile)-lysidine synthase [Paracoccus halophilus]|uniref:tRNA(Ile)-lysidine synthase n=1 Tax=Paracoccus halophilus TaxID=376733 RepID=A0A099F7P8_9RHOB|nr:tRNA lysidine(34) synthetase TilS [Paracoccus halophilus]KGJ06725.1 tRNA(Ile)-lysidine synthetase [Paracoccus halophilus]SFA41975.1 tRNA(Ile)-lysidine synthase [Paracoccus halophilus]